MGQEGQSGDSNNRKGRKMMMEWNRVVAIGIKKMGRKYVERIGKIFGDRFMGEKQGEGDKVDSQVSGVNWVNDGPILSERGKAQWLCAWFFDFSDNGNVAGVGKGMLSWRCL